MHGHKSKHIGTLAYLHMAEHKLEGDNGCRQYGIDTTQHPKPNLTREHKGILRNIVTQIRKRGLRMVMLVINVKWIIWREEHSLHRFYACVYFCAVSSQPSRWKRAAGQVHGKDRVSHGRLEDLSGQDLARGQGFGNPESRRILSAP